MKKLAFVGISLFSICFCVGDLLGGPIRNSRRHASNSYDFPANRRFDTSRETSRVHPNRSVSDRGGDDIEKRSRRQRNRYMSDSERYNENFDERERISKRQQDENVSSNNKNSETNNNTFSGLKLEENISSALKSIIGCVSERDIRALISNMDSLSRSLKRSQEEDVKTVIGKMKEASSCLDELLRVRFNLYRELFNKTERRKESSDSVELGGVIEKLNRIDMKKLGKIISICDQERLSKQIIQNLKDFSDKIKESKNILAEMKRKFSPIMLSRIEGIPELKHLEATDTMSNQELAERRKSFDSNNSSENNSDEKNNSESEEEVSSQSSGDSQKKSEEKEDDSENNRLNQEKKQTIFDLLKSGIFEKKASEEKEDSKDEKNDNVSSDNTEINSSDENNQINSSQSESENASEQQKDIQKSSWKILNWGTKRNSEKQLSGENQDEKKSEKESEENKNSEQDLSENVNLEEENNQFESEKTSSSSGKKIDEEQNEDQDSQISSDVSGESSIDSNKAESPEKFYEFLGTNIELLDEATLTNKQKTGLEKIKGYLKETKTDRNFEKKVSDVRKIIRAYNSLIALNPKTKNGKKLRSVPGDKIKSLQEKIYLDIFDDLTIHLEKLKSNKKFNGLDIREDFDKVLNLNNSNKEKFQKSQSGKDKRKIMTSSVEAYDNLMEKIWKYPNLVKTKKDREQFDRIGYTLDSVILSINVD